MLTSQFCKGGVGVGQVLFGKSQVALRSRTFALSGAQVALRTGDVLIDLAQLLCWHIYPVGMCHGGSQQ
ncbi:hypothetical protein R85157_002516 [Carnimonas sp. R-85157]